MTWFDVHPMMALLCVITAAITILVVVFRLTRDKVILTRGEWTCPFCMEHLQVQALTYPQASAALDEARKNHLNTHNIGEPLR